MCLLRFLGFNKNKSSDIIDHNTQYCHFVESGDTIERLAKKFDVSEETIINAAGKNIREYESIDDLGEIKICLFIPVGTRLLIKKSLIISPV